MTPPSAAFDRNELPTPDWVLSVFVGPDGSGGNELPVYLPGSLPDRGRRSASAEALGVHEVLFVDDVVTGRISIYSPTGEMEFAGHPAVGAAWVLGRV